MIIQEIPKEFQPQYKSNYPSYSSGKNIEEIVYEILKQKKEEIITDYIYLPVFWTSYYVLNNYGKNIQKLLEWMKKLDKTKKYFTIVQYASGVFIDNKIDLNITVFSAGGGGLNIKNNTEKQISTPFGNRSIFIGNKSTYSIPLICNPLFPYEEKNKDIFCSFMGRLDTHPCRVEMKKILEKNKKFKFFNSTNFDKYKEIVNRSIFTLSPRGYGYTSFRIYEAILAESIPIYIWEDKKILPFEEDLNWEEFSIIIHSSEIKILPKILERTDKEKLLLKIKEIKKLISFESIYKYIKEKIKN